MADKKGQRYKEDRNPRNLSQVACVYRDANKVRKYKGMTYNHRDGSVLVTDMHNKEVCTVDMANERVESLFKLHQGGNAVNGITVTSDGLIAVSDYYQANINLYSHDSYEFVKSFTGVQLKGPNGLAVNEKGHMFVAESNKKCVSVFDKDGSYLYGFGKTAANAGEAHEGKFVWPYQISIPPDGLVYVSDTQGSLIQVFEQNGTHIRDIGKGVVNGPSGITMTPDGYLVASSIRKQSVCFFTANGRCVHEYTKSGVLESHGVAVNQAGTIFIFDYSNSQIVQI